MQTCHADAPDSISSISWLYRSVQHAVQSTDALPLTPAPNTHSLIQPSTSAGTGNCAPDAVLHQDNGEPDSGAPSPAVDGSSPPIFASAPGRHNLGPESTWAVRQSAELEDLQAALDQQCFRRGRPAAEVPAAAADTAAAASAAEGDSMSPPDLQDPAESKYVDLDAAGAGLLCPALLLVTCNVASVACMRRQPTANLLLHICQWV